MTTGMTETADAALRTHVRAVLTERQAHLMLDDVLKDFPVERINDRVEGLPYSAWDLLSHLRFTQRDILNFVRDAEYTEPDWPANYWPGKGQAASAGDWEAEARAFRDDQTALLALLDDSAVDLLATVPNGEGQTWLREFLLVADHNAYHVGELMLLGRLLGGA